MTDDTSTTREDFGFDEAIDSRGLGSIKWDFLVSDGTITQWDRTDPALGDQQVLPMWVADMDFKAAPAIREAMAARLAHGVFGYAKGDRDYLDALVDWMRDRQGWHVEPEWVVAIPGVVTALHLAVRRFSEPGDQVLIQRPVYHPFSYAAQTNDRELVNNALRLSDGRYEMDFDDLAAKTADPRLKIALLCSPHNPVGRVWSREELTEFGRICARNDVLVVADEIHADLTLPGHDFTPYANTAPDLFEKAIICTATSKAFNLAGFKTSSLIIRDQELRTAVETELRSWGVYGVPLFGLVATEAAYRHGAEWLDAVVAYIDANLDFLEAFLRTELPGITLVRPEGTYLAWLDCRELGLPHERLVSLFFEDARLYLDEGKMFGDEGEGFMRLNVACPRSRLEEALARLEEAVGALNLA